MPGEMQRPGLWMTLEDRAAIFENYSNFFKKYYLLTEKIASTGYLELYELPNLKSSDLNVFLAKRMYMTRKSWKKSDFPGAQKCLLMDYFGQFDVVLPIVTFQF